MKRFILGVIIGLCLGGYLSDASYGVPNQDPKEMPNVITFNPGPVNTWTIEQRRSIENLVRQINDANRLIFEGIR